MSKILALILTLLFILFPDEIKKGALSGINAGLFVLIPSLFPYMVISQMFLKTGASEIINTFTYRFAKKLFRFQKPFSAAYLLSLFCGYPTGARLACELEDCGEREALRLFVFGNVPGFGFCVSFLGSLFGNTRLGFFIYLSFVCASVILNFLFSFFLKDNENCKADEIISESFANAITKSVKESALSILSVIGYAVFFSSISNMCGNFIKDKALLAVFSAFCEITSGIPLLCSIAPNAAFFAVFFTGFSGFSVIFQSLSFKKSDFPIMFILFSRLLFALVSVLVFGVFNFCLK